MHSNGLPGGCFSTKGRFSLTRLHAQPVIAPSLAPAGALRRALRKVGALSSAPIARVGDRFGLFLVLHDEAGELPNSYTAARERGLTY
jgi:hypothetical protein